MPHIGAQELIIILVIVLIIFGAKRVPELGRSLGSGMRNFKDAVTGGDGGEDEQRDPRPVPEPAGLPAPSTGTAQDPPPEPAPTADPAPAGSGAREEVTTDTAPRAGDADR